MEKNQCVYCAQRVQKCKDSRDGLSAQFRLTIRRGDEEEKGEEKEKEAGNEDENEKDKEKETEFRVSEIKRLA